MTILSDEYQRMAANEICHVAAMIGEEARISAQEYRRPCVIWRPRLFIDGNRWCAFYGENLQYRVAGFGDSPANAMLDFDKAWNMKLEPQETQVKSNAWDNVDSYSPSA